LLIELQRHLALLQQVADTVLAGELVHKPVKLDTDYWQWYEGEGRARVEQSSDVTLRAEWASLGDLHARILTAAQAAMKVASQGDKLQARQLLSDVFRLSSELTGILVGSSMHELTSVFSVREKQLAARIERDFMEAAQVGQFSVNLADNTLADPDAAFLDFLGYTKNEADGLEIQKIFDSRPFQQLLKMARSKEANSRVSFKARHKDGHRVALEVFAILDENGGGVWLRCFTSNVSQSESDIQQRRLLSTAIEVSDQVVVITNAKQEIVYVNPAFTKLTGYEAKEVLGKNPRLLQGKETNQATRIAIREALSAGRSVSVEIFNYTKEGLRFWVDISIVPVTDDSGEVTHFVAVQHDITERKATEQAIARIALEDHLTGLPNRRAAEDRLGMEWQRARRGTGGFALAIVDVDRFKLVNDQYGHQVGDLALKHISETIASNLRGGDWIGRWGGEEFLLCLHEMDHRGAHTAAERLRKIVKAKPIKCAVGELSFTVSMGVALYNEAHENVDAMLALADSLLYEAKHTGRDKVMCSGRGGTRKGSVNWEGSQVQGAIQDGRVLPVFQTIVDLRTGKVVADEALARIRAKDDSLVSAHSFIEAAEALHLVSAIDKTISSGAMEHCARTLTEKNGRAHFINLSHQFLANPELVAKLLQEARDASTECGVVGCDLRPMVIEITERQGSDIQTLKKNLQPLIDAGFRLALDDFGSGYSSFLYLTELPVDFLKVEGWMVSRITKDERVRQLVETLVSTARKFNIITVAECVEDEETANLLRDIGVDWGQGYYFARPEIEER
jgi:diguanylate cyclase (GGDEF)-like protein/PAS domain S-box-containing protein